MIDDAPRTPRSDPKASSVADPVPADVCGHAITEVVRLILELTSTNAAIDYENGARVRTELEHAFLEARQTFEALPEGAVRTEALRRLDGLRIIAERQFAIAPAPSATAIAAADAGDASAWFREADEWAAVRLGRGLSRPRPSRRPRSDTRPGSPRALRVEPDDTSRAMTQGPLAPVAPTDPALDEERR